MIARSAEKSVVNLERLKNLVSFVYIIIERIFKEHSRAGEYEDYLKVVADGAQKRVE